MPTGTKKVTFAVDTTFEGEYYEAGTEIEIKAEDLKVINPAVLVDSDVVKEMQNFTKQTRVLRAVRTQKPYPQYANGIPEEISTTGGGRQTLEIYGNTPAMTSPNPEDHGEQSLENPAAQDSSDPKVAEAESNGTPVITTESEDEERPGRPTA